MPEQRKTKWYIDRYWKESFNWNKDGSVNLKGTAIDWLLIMWGINLIFLGSIIGTIYWLIEETLSHIKLIGAPIAVLIGIIILLVFYLIKSLTSDSFFMFSYKKQLAYHEDDYQSYLSELERLTSE